MKIGFIGCGNMGAAMIGGILKKGGCAEDESIVGIAPGKTLAWLEEKCEQPLKVVRLMPNTPAQVGEGMTGACANDRVTKEDLDQILAITNSFGRTEVVPERLMDAVGAVSG